MTSISMTARLGDIEQYKFNPAKMQRNALEALRAITNGDIDVVDATNPFVFCMETTAVNTAAFMVQAEALTRRQYAAVAMTPEDIYLHMGDKDYIGRFALPTKASFTLMFQKDELLQALVLDPSTGIRKLTIPRNTVFSIAEVSFSLQYPVDIRELVHGGLQIVYDVSQLSPLQTLPTNVIEWEEVCDPSGLAFLQFSVEATQFDILTKLNDVNAASGFKTTFTLTDSFYYARVYSQQSDGTWKEIPTTHTQQVYDPKTPTAVIKVLDKTVTVVIPVVYTTTGQIRNKLRIDVYQTKGALSMLLSNYNLEDFSVQWKAIDANDATSYVAPLSSLKTMGFFSLSAVTGGRAALSMDELRSRVVQNNVGPKDIPITNVELQSNIEDSGYEVVKNVDTITNRIFLATKPMPKPMDERLITAAPSSVVTAVLTFSQMQQAYGVISHAFGVTLTPDTLYESIGGVTYIVSQSQYAALSNLTNAQRCIEVNAKNYLYTPFHYVLDGEATSGEDAGFDVRPYYLDSPQILTKSFVAENAATGLQASVASNYSIQRIPTGYRLVLTTRSSNEFKALSDEAVFAQLSFKVSGDTVAAFMLGVQQPRAAADDERVYVFDMITRFNLNAAHQLDQTSFTYSPTDLTTRCELLQEMSVFFATTTPLVSNLPPTEVDNGLGRFQLPLNIVGVTHEKLKIRFGHALDTLWSRGRSVTSSVQYKQYATDVPQLYLQDEYLIDPLTNSAFSLDAAGALQYTLLHKKNTPVLDYRGNPQYLHQAGEVMLDSYNRPITQDNYLSELTRYVDITVIDAVYRFATDAVALTYRQYIAQSLVSWLIEDLASLNATLLDQTKIYFYPKVTQGDIQVMSRKGVEAKIPAAQSFMITLYVPKATAQSSDLLAAIKKSTIKTIDLAIKGVTTAISSIEMALRSQYGTDVIDVKLEGLGGLENYNALTVLDKSTRLSLRKRLVSLPDDQLIVEEDVEFVIIEHSVTI
jgi:hypothetical protein